MEIIIAVIKTLFITSIAENILFSHGLGADLTAFVRGDRKKIFVFGVAVTYMCTVTNIFVSVVDRLFGAAENYRFYRPVFYICVLCLMYFASVALVWKISEEKAEKGKKYLHYAVFNSAVLGTMLLSSVSCKTVSSYILYGIGSGLGFAAALFLISSVYDRLNGDNVPSPFRGFPLLMIYLGILSMAFSAL